MLLHDGTVAGVGDTVVARRVDRHLSDGTAHAATGRNGRLTEGFVKNGTTFTITAVHRNGGITARATGPDTDQHMTNVPESAVLPADYVAEHVELGYAATAHRSQGRTVDTTHTIATNRMTREAFYVALTRGTLANHAYIAIDAYTNADNHSAFGQTLSGRSTLLRNILANRAAGMSAHETFRAVTLDLGDSAKIRTHGERSDALGVARVLSPLTPRQGFTAIEN